MSLFSYSISPLKFPYHIQYYSWNSKIRVFVVSLAKCLLSTHLRIVYAVKGNTYMKWSHTNSKIHFHYPKTTNAVAAAEAAASASLTALSLKKVEKAYTLLSRRHPQYRTDMCKQRCWPSVLWPEEERTKNKKSISNDIPSKIEFGNILSLLRTPHTHTPILTLAFTYTQPKSYTTALQLSCELKL